MAQGWQSHPLAPLVGRPGVGETHKSNMWCMAPHVCHIYDDQGVGLLEDFLFPIYKLIREMLMRLAHTHLVPPDDLPHF